MARPDGINGVTEFAALIAQHPAALGQGTMAQSMATVIASDQTPVPTGSKAVKIAVTPTLDTSAYDSGDCLHTAVMTFAGAARSNGLTSTIVKVMIIDKDVQSAAGELWLFDTTVTPATANAAHSISDGDAANCIGVIPFGTYYASALNSVSVNASISLNFKAATADTAIYGILVTRGTPTYTASGLTVSLLVVQN